MDIKYTIEILTKDIQDIEKLVGKLQNSKDASAIELDLAMSKLRNVYEILTMIKADRLNDLVSKSFNGSQEPENEVHAEPPSAPETETPPMPEPVAEAPKEAEPAPEPMPEPEPEPEPEPDPEPEKDLSTAKAEDPTILAEKFQAESSINENLAGSRSEPLDAKFLGSAIENIGRNIGINDRFLIIRELFDNDSDRFSSLLGQLDGAENYENASQILESKFADSMEHEGVEILTGLVKRRYLR